MSSNTQELTKYQADARDIRTRLDLMPPIDLDLPPKDVKARLCKIPHSASSDGEPSGSLFEYLETPKDGVTRLEAATRVLNELTDKTEDIASTTRLVMAYVQQNALWMNLQNPRSRSQEGFLQTLTNTTALRINLILGTWTDKDRERYINVANDFWGIGWFDKIPEHLLPPLTSQTGGVAYRDLAKAEVPQDLSKRMLEAMAANCKLGISFENAIKGWDKNRIARQTRPSVPLADRRALRQPKTSRKLHMVVEDVQSLNVKRLPGELLAEKTGDLLGLDTGDNGLKLAPHVYTKEEGGAQQHEQEKAKETEGAEEAEEQEVEDRGGKQQHEKEKKTSSTTQRVSMHASKKRDRASDSSTSTTAPNKRVRRAEDLQGTEELTNGKRILSRSDSWRLVKTRNGHLVREPIRIAAEEEESESSSALQQHDLNSQSHSSGLAPQISMVTQDQPEILSQYTQRQDTVSVGSSQNDSEPKSDEDHNTTCESSAVLDRLSNRLQLS